jgi:hypothetical protein
MGFKFWRGYRLGGSFAIFQKLDHSPKYYFLTGSLAEHQRTINLH